MIKASELRLGNLFADLSGKVHPVKGIHEDCIVIEYFHAVSSDFTLGGEGDFNKVWPTKSISFENALPILLTDDILEKCGFALVRDYWQSEFVDIDHDGDGFYLCTEDQYEGNLYTLSKPFYHLHQLQNLFYFLTGQEIDIKLQPCK